MRFALPLALVLLASNALRSGGIARARRTPAHRCRGYRFHRGPDLDGGPRRHQGREDLGDRRDGRGRAERAVPRHRQAQRRAPGDDRVDRAEARKRARRSHHRLRTGRRLRPADGAHEAIQVRSACPRRRTRRFSATSPRASRPTDSEHVIFIGDSGGNQTGMKEVAAELTARFGGKPGVHFIPEFYDYDGLMTWLDGAGTQAGRPGTPRRLRNHLDHDDRRPRERSLPAASGEGARQHQRSQDHSRREDPGSRAESRRMAGDKTVDAIQKAIGAKTTTSQ